MEFIIVSKSGDGVEKIFCFFNSVYVIFLVMSYLWFWVFIGYNFLVFWEKKKEVGGGIYYKYVCYF